MARLIMAHGESLAVHGHCARPVRHPRPLALPNDVLSQGRKCPGCGGKGRRLVPGLPAAGSCGCEWQRGGTMMTCSLASVARARASRGMCTVASCQGSLLGQDIPAVVLVRGPAGREETGPRAPDPLHSRGVRGGMKKQWDPCVQASAVNCPPSGSSVDGALGRWL